MKDVKLTKTPLCCQAQNLATHVFHNLSRNNLPLPQGYARFLWWKFHPTVSSYLFIISYFSVFVQPKLMPLPTFIAISLLHSTLTTTKSHKVVKLSGLFSKVKVKLRKLCKSRDSSWSNPPQTFIVSTTRHIVSSLCWWLDSSEILGMSYGKEKSTLHFLSAQGITHKEMSVIKCGRNEMSWAGR